MSEDRAPEGGASGPGPWQGPPPIPLRHPHPGTFIICHKHRGSGDREWDQPHTLRPTQMNREMTNVSIMPNLKICRSLFTKMIFTPLRWRLWCDVTSVTLSRGGQRSEHSKAREWLRQYKTRDIEDNRVLSSNHKVTSATSYKMTSRVSSLFCEPGPVSCHRSVIMDQVLASWQHCHGLISAIIAIKWANTR